MTLIARRHRVGGQLMQAWQRTEATTMTTYPLSEPATIYRKAGHDGPDTERAIVARGSLSDCAEILEDWSEADRAAVEIEIDDMSLRYGPQEIEELLAFLREEANPPSGPI